MIIIPFELLSAQTGCKSTLGTVTITNIKQERINGSVLADYLVQAYPKRTTRESILRGSARHHRSGIVRAHPKHARPVWELMAKALKALGYED